MAFLSKNMITSTMVGVALFTSALPSGEKDYLARALLSSSKEKSSVLNSIKAIKETADLMAAIKAATWYAELDQEKKDIIDANLNRSIEKQVRGLNKDIYDAALLGFVGKDMYKGLQDFDTSGKTGAIGLAFAVKGAEAAGNAFLEGTSKRLSFILESGLDTIGGYCSNIQQFVYKKITGRVGYPFNYEDVNTSRKLIGELLTTLIKTSGKAGQMGMRDRMLRPDGEEEVTLDPLWASLRGLIVNKLRNQIALLDLGLSYYKKDQQSHIALYAHQIKDSLAILVDTIILKTMSHQDLASGNYQHALLTLQKSIESDFESLLKNLPQVSKDARTTAMDQMKGRSDRRDRDDVLSGLS